MKTKKVLIVDANDMNRRLIENLIEHLCGYESVKSGLEAVEKASQVAFDLILMDLQMPVMDGITTAQTIWRKSPYNCPIIAVSSYSEAHSKKCLLEMGFTALISKPIRPKDFLEAVSDILSCTEDEKISFSKPPEIIDEKVFQQLSKFNSVINLRSLYIEFIEEFDGLIHLIDKAFQEKDKQTLIKHLHTIKGNSGTLGVNAIFTFSSEADLLARAENWDALGTALKNLINERVIFKKYLEEETIFNP
ncbi:response regulator [Algoriphagus winogradskyi]|uniref:CheY chemotaxis protein or a CheY-like REC (Receiver) domain n=1 Tax=Algoriphagus winogradskyi TaxID=237017 RepID=A0ABY1NZH1_9BACT|nr:hybrid sensor histidine kinase/response regulator [Algoriphagus winogradskyi]SMP22485.1 CheY chemotaxis protein or a CheY-like REC (receiver) domain [Algoriphagus winogradskyi]